LSSGERAELQHLQLPIDAAPFQDRGVSGSGRLRTRGERVQETTRPLFGDAVLGPGHAVVLYPPEAATARPEHCATVRSPGQISHALSERKFGRMTDMVAWRFTYRQALGPRRGLRRSGLRSAAIDHRIIALPSCSCAIAFLEMSLRGSHAAPAEYQFAVMPKETAMKPIASVAAARLARRQTA
jgi:hypothetical protein